MKGELGLLMPTLKIDAYRTIALANVSVMMLNFCRADNHDEFVFHTFPMLPVPRKPAQSLDQTCRHQGGTGETGPDGQRPIRLTDYLQGNVDTRRAL
jgi:hypothetical protein